MDNLKILFAVVSIGVYIYTQLKESSKKEKNSNSIPQNVSNPESNKQQSYSKTVTIPVSSYAAPKNPYQAAPKNVSKRYQSKYNKAEEMRQLREELDGNKPKEIIREAFYKNTDNEIDANKSLFKDKNTKNEDEHLKPYSLQNKKKHPLLTFLSNKNNLKNGFITGEIMKRPL